MKCSTWLHYLHLLLLESHLEMKQKRVLQHPAWVCEAVPRGDGGEHSGCPTPAATQLLCSCPKARLLPGDAEANRRANFKDRWLTSVQICPHHLWDDPIMSSARGQSQLQPLGIPKHDRPEQCLVHAHGLWHALAACPWLLLPGDMAGDLSSCTGCLGLIWAYLEHFWEMQHRRTRRGGLGEEHWHSSECGHLALALQLHWACHGANGCHHPPSCLPRRLKNNHLPLHQAGMCPCPPSLHPQYPGPGTGGTSAVPWPCSGPFWECGWGSPSPVQTQSAGSARVCTSSASPWGDVQLPCWCSSCRTPAVLREPAPACCPLFCFFSAAAGKTRNKQTGRTMLSRNCSLPPGVPRLGL